MAQPEGPEGITPLSSTNVTAALLGVHPKSLRRLARLGRVPVYRIGRADKYDILEVREALRQAAPRPKRSVPARNGKVRLEPDLDALDGPRRRKR
jgi:hypothetical protein